MHYIIGASIYIFAIFALLLRTKRCIEIIYWVMASVKNFTILPTAWSHHEDADDDEDDDVFDDDQIVPDVAQVSKASLSDFQVL